MYQAIFTFEVPEEKQEAYLKATAEVIKPFWEAHECASYEVFQDYFGSPRRFVKIQHYPDKATMERSLALARQDERGRAVVALFLQFAEKLDQRRVVPVLDGNGIVRRQAE
jgi:quinol monooxygenase YgiN